MSSDTKFFSKIRRLKHLYKVVNKDSQSIFFVRKKAQEIFEAKRLDMKKRKWYVKLIVLKWRQLWITTAACINNLDEVMMRSNLSTVITAHQQDKQREIFKKVEYAYNNFPNKVLLKNGKTFYKRKTRLKNIKEIFFKKNNSGIQVSLDSRSWTFQRVHITELAFRHDAEEMMTGTIPAVPKHWEIVIETTANGIWNYFHDLRVENYKNPKWAWECLFLGWWLDEDYQMELEDGEVIELPPELQHLNNPMLDWTILTEEQKRWYYEQYKSLGKRCFQEYPCSPDEAFLNTGDPVFDLWTIKSYAKLPFTIDPIFPDLRIYTKPDYEYCTFGVDTSEWWVNGDFSSIKVRDQDLRLLASFYGRIPPDELCRVIDRLISLWYMGTLGIERNNTGIATIAEAKNYERYSLIFKEKTIDKTTNRMTQKIGWHTNAKTRPLLLTDYVALVRQWLLPNISEDLRHEMFSFIFAENGRPEANKGNHDDGIMSDAICCYMRKFPIFIN